MNSKKTAIPDQVAKDTSSAGSNDLSALGVQPAVVQGVSIDAFDHDAEHGNLAGLTLEQRKERGSHLLISDLPVREDNDGDGTRAAPKTRQPQSHPRATSRKAMRQRKRGG